MSSNSPLSVLCLASYYKGIEFMKQAKREGCRVLLLTSKSLEEADWPRESLDEIFYMPDIDNEWNLRDVKKSVSYLARTEVIDRIVALDDYDLEAAAMLREHLRVPGMGGTTTRYFRDKLAMRLRAREKGIKVPDFTHVLNHDKLNQYLETVKPPWLIKPRSLAGAHGIQKFNAAEKFWKAIEILGDKQSEYVLEQFIPGTIYHVDSIVFEKKIIFDAVHQYGITPLDVSHEGGVFTSTTVERGSQNERAIKMVNRSVLKTMGHVNGVSHTEFIQSEKDNQIYFLETSARVGGAHIGELVEAASGLNLWTEWAKIECNNSYHLAETNENYAGLILSLAHQEFPDTSAFSDNEIVWRLNKPYHAGLIVKSEKKERVQMLIDEYSKRFYKEFYTSQPLPHRPTS